MSRVVVEASGFLQLFSDGSVKRFAPEIAEASSTPTYGFMSKDVIIDSEKSVTARVFIPESSHNTTLPVLVYFHGGGFCIGSTTWLGYHVFLGDFSVISQCIVVSLDYRLAPEHRLPIAYEDCFSALEWLVRQVDSDSWFKQADLSRVFLSGDSAGGNIAHHVALKALTSKISQVEIKGLMLIHPYFGSEKRTQNEMTDGAKKEVASNDMFWKLSIPEGSNRDYYGCNFETCDELSLTQWHENFPSVLVFVAGLDFLKERGVLYAEFLKKKIAREVKLVEAEGESHVFNIFRPHSDATRLMQKEMSEFMKSFYLSNKL